MTPFQFRVSVTIRKWNIDLDSNITQILGAVYLLCVIWRYFWL